jgi:SAM-dependent methyltransferase
MDSEEGLTVSEYDRAGDFYYDFIKRITQGGLPLYAKTILELLGNVEGKRVCDLACGEGYVSRILAEKGARVTGVDLSLGLLEHARRQSESSDIEYLHDDAQILASLSDVFFDMVICNMALMDIPGLEPTYQAVRRILKDHGVFIFSILHPCFESPFTVDDGGQIEVDQDGDFVACRVTRYTEEGKWYTDGTGVRGTLGSIHRKLSTYVNALIRTGFDLRSLAEPTEPRGNYEDVSEQWYSRIPRFLIVESVKR